jgi:hypothetical protein
VRRFLLAVLLLAAAGCSEPPQKEIDQAQSAIDAARAAGADHYAADEYAGATATLEKAHASVEQRDYRQALSYALDARQRALEATRLVPEARAKAKASANADYKATADRVAHLETALHAAESAKVPARELRSARQTLAAAQTTMQEARSLIDQGNAAGAAAALLKVRGNVDAAAATVTSIPRHPKPAKGRRR